MNTPSPFFFLKFKKRILLYAIFLCAVIVGGSFFLKSFLNKNQQTAVVLTDSGFNPSNITLKVGDTLLFVNKSSQPFWPASDPHPTHTAYSAFDSKKPIARGGTWSFTFTQSGIWSFHDHIDPLFTGVVTVTDGSSTIDIQAQCVDNPSQCYEQTLRSIVRSQGLVSALDKMAELYEQNADFRANCHAYTHAVGQEAYTLYKNTGDLESTSKAEYCGFGFYHGLMEAMLHDTGDVAGAKQLCAQFGNDLSKESPAAVFSCYHGIGHGVVDGSDPATWGSSDAMIHSGLALCEQVGDTEYLKKICGTGVFNSLAVMLANSEYELVPNKDNPYDICYKQEKEYFREACFEDMNTLVLNLGGENFGQALKYIRPIENDRDAHFAVRSLALAPLSNNENNSEENVSACQSLIENLQGPCVEGLAVGIIEGGLVEKKIYAAFDFCDTKNMFLTNKSVCYERVLGFIQRIASADIYSKACTDAEARYKTMCASAT